MYSWKAVLNLLFKRRCLWKENQKDLPPRKNFCNCFVSCGSADEAAYNAGFVRNPKRSGEELLCREDIADEIKRLGKCRTSSLSEIATVGYRRLAFGKISDAVSLLYMENPSREQLEHMDLFLVSEIKRPKDGSMEIKFLTGSKHLKSWQTTAKKRTGQLLLWRYCQGSGGIEKWNRWKLILFQNNSLRCFRGGARRADTKITTQSSVTVQCVRAKLSVWAFRFCVELLQLCKFGFCPLRKDYSLSAQKYGNSDNSRA